jgi:hypothetical protein
MPHFHHFCTSIPANLDSSECHAENCVDRLIGQTGLIRIAGRERCFEIGIIQPLLSDGNQVRRDIHANDASATLEQWDNVFPCATTEVEYGLASNVCQQVKSVLKSVRSIRRRIQVEDSSSGQSELGQGSSERTSWPRSHCVRSRLDCVLIIESPS